MRALLPRPGPVDPEEAYALPGGPTDPHVRANMVSSADGAAEEGGHSEALSSPADKALFRLLRSLADVVLVGAGTVRAEDYGPVRLSDEQRSRRLAEGRTPTPAMAVISERLDLDPAARLFIGSGPRPLVLTCTAADADRRAALAPVADVLDAGESSVDLAAALDALASRGLPRVLCEGGPRLLGALLATGRLDELCLTVAPLLAGAGHRRIVEGAPLDRLLRLDLRHVLEEDGMLFLRYSAAGASSAPSGPSSAVEDSSSAAAAVSPGSP